MTQPDAKIITPSEAQAAARLAAVVLGRSFEAVFGQLGKRNEHQTRVIAHLEAQSGEGDNSYQFNTARDGVALIAAGIHRDGAKSILLFINRQLERARHNVPAPKPPRVSKR